MANKHWNPETVAPPFGHYSQSVVVPENSRLLYISGQVGVKPNGEMASGFKDQAIQTFRNIQSILEANGMVFSDVVKLGVYLTNADDVADYRQARDTVTGQYTSAERAPADCGPAARAPADCGPASTLVVVSALAHPDWLVEVEAYAAISQ